MKQRFIITGTGRSGTKWCATALRVNGIYCGHEQVFSTAGLNELADPSHYFIHNRYDGDCSLAALPYIQKYGYKDFRKILVVRNPLDTALYWVKVGSFFDHGLPEGLEDYLRLKYPDIFDSDSELEAALKYWFYWNKDAVGVVDEVVNLENLNGEKLLGLVGLLPEWIGYPVLNINSSFDYPRVGWGMVPRKLRNDISTLAKQLGYEI